MSNPLLESSSLPLFDRIQPADVAPAIDTLLARASEAVGRSHKISPWASQVLWFSECRVMPSSAK